VAYFNFKKESLSRLILSLPFVVSLIFLKSVLFIKYGLTFIIFAPFYFIFFLIMIFFFKIKINKILLSISLIAMISIYLVAFYHNDLTYIYFAGNSIMAFMIFSLVDRDLFLKIVKISSLIISFMLIGAWITFFHIYFTNSFPETTFETWAGAEILSGVLSFGVKLQHTESYIFRASSIYDEPGTFSFVIVFIAAIRHFLDMNKKNTWMILILGFVTISLAHLIYVILHLLTEKLNFKKLIILIYSLVLTFIISKNYISFAFLNEIFNNFFYRIVIDQDFLIGGNRKENFIYTFSMLQNFHLNNWFFGTDKVDPGCCNPLVHLVKLGLVGSWLNYLIMIFFLVYSILKKNLIVFAIFLILIQRPAIYSTGAAFLVAALFFSLNLFKNNKKHKS
jgi:hypothetical protein